MEVSKVNSLVELFLKKLEEVDNKKPLLYSLKSEKKFITGMKYPNVYLDLQTK